MKGCFDEEGEYRKMKGTLDEVENAHEEGYMTSSALRKGEWVSPGGVFFKEGD